MQSTGSCAAGACWACRCRAPGSARCTRAAARSRSATPSRSTRGCRCWGSSSPTAAGWNRPMSESAPVIVFDGVCVLCSRWVDFVLKHDRAGDYRLAAMQGAHGRALLQAHGLSADDPVSFLLVQDGRGHTDTDAILRVLRSFGGRWLLAAALLRAIPRFCRDPAYRWIARHRYRLFGRRASCRLPEPAQAWRFLD